MRPDMKTYERELDFAQAQAWRPARTPGCRPGHLHLVSAQEIEELGEHLARGNVPSDLEANLIRLTAGDLGHRFIEQNCRTMIALVEAARSGSFKEAGLAECERLLRVLAYVRKDDDAIPDYRADGFVDDQQEVRYAAAEMGALLKRFKAWRLRNQVPAMWAPYLCAQSGQEPPRAQVAAGHAYAR